MKKAYYGSTSGEAGKHGHRLLREMVHNPKSLARGQDMLRGELFDITKVSGGAPASELEHTAVPDSHSRARGSVAPSRRKS